MSVATDFKVVGNLVNYGNATELRVGAQPDILQGSTAQNKLAFDNYCDMIASRHNQLCDFVESDISATVDREVIELFASDGWVAD